jgi:hypothetical protein
MLNTSSPLIDLGALTAPAGGAPSWPRTVRQQPLVIPESGGKPRSFTRVTTLAGVLSDESSLTKWKMRIVMAGAASARSLTDAARGIDPETPEGKRQLSKLADRAFAAGGGNAKSERGTWLHLLSEHVDRDEELPPCSAEDRDDMDAYRRAVAPLRMKAIEQPMVNTALGAAGTADRIAETELRTPDGDVAGHVIVDLKTGGLDYAALKIACQLKTYASGRCYDPLWWLSHPDDPEAIARWRAYEFTEEQAAQAYSDIPELNQDWGIVVHLPAGTGTARLVWVDLGAVGEALEDATRVRAWRSRRDLLVPVPTNLFVTALTL